jgi:hypothetical protein
MDSAPDEQQEPDEQPKSWLAERVSKLSGEGSRDKFWLRHGFGSLAEYIEHVERSWDDVPWANPPPKVPKVAPPALAAGAGGAGETETRRRSRQVGMRLAPEDYDVLAEAAEAHGVAPSTLARILTVAGAKALVSRTRSA